MDDESVIDQAWRENRTYLVDLAFRMLRDIGEAEDVVQAAFAQLLQADAGEIEDARAWLTVVTSRLCLNRIQSAQRRRERAADPGVLAEAALGQSAPDPADRVTLDDRVRLALLVVLERLTPAERVAFVLHDVFAAPFDAVAESLGRSPASCRQLARRARRKLEEAHGRQVDVSALEHREVTDRFIAACAGGDITALMAVLDPDVDGEADFGGGGHVQGASRVARGIMRFWSGLPTNYYGTPVTIVSYPVGEQTALLGYAEQTLIGMLLLDIVDERVHSIHAVIHPDKVAFLDAQLQMSR